MVFKKIIFQNSLMANETPSRPPPLHGKCHLKFPFWFSAPFPYHIQCKSVSHTLFHIKTCLKCDSGCTLFINIVIVAIDWTPRLRFHLSSFYYTDYKSCAYSLVCPQIQKLQTVLWYLVWCQVCVLLHILEDDLNRLLGGRMRSCQS